MVPENVVDEEDQLITDINKNCLSLCHGYNRFRKSGCRSQKCTNSEDIEQVKKKYYDLLDSIINSTRALHLKERINILNSTSQDPIVFSNLDLKLRIIILRFVNDSGYINILTRRKGVINKTISIFTRKFKNDEIDFINALCAHLEEGRANLELPTQLEEERADLELRPRLKERKRETKKINKKIIKKPNKTQNNSNKYRIAKRASRLKTYEEIWGPQKLYDEKKHIQELLDKSKNEDNFENEYDTRFENVIYDENHRENKLLDKYYKAFEGFEDVGNKDFGIEGFETSIAENAILAKEHRRSLKAFETFLENIENMREEFRGHNAFLQNLYSKNIFWTEIRGLFTIDKTGIESVDPDFIEMIERQKESEFLLIIKFKNQILSIEPDDPNAKNIIEKYRRKYDELMKFYHIHDVSQYDDPEHYLKNLSQASQAEHPERINKYKERYNLARSNTSKNWVEASDTQRAKYLEEVEGVDDKTRDEIREKYSKDYRKFLDGIRGIGGKKTKKRR